MSECLCLMHIYMVMFAACVSMPAYVSAMSTCSFAYVCTCVSVFATVFMSVSSSVSVSVSAYVSVSVCSIGGILINALSDRRQRAQTTRVCTQHGCNLRLTGRQVPRNSATQVLDIVDRPTLTTPRVPVC